MREIWWARLLTLFFSVENQNYFLKFEIALFFIDCSHEFRNQVNRRPFWKFPVGANSFLPRALLISHYAANLQSPEKSQRDSFHDPRLLILELRGLCHHYPNWFFFTLEKSNFYDIITIATLALAPSMDQWLPRFLFIPLNVYNVQHSMFYLEENNNFRNSI